MARQRKKPSAKDIFAANVRRLRKEQGLSQDAFAHLAGVHRTYCGAVERSEKNVTINNIERFAEALGVSVPEILTEYEGD